MKTYTLQEYEKMIADIETELKKSLDMAKSESAQPLAKSEEASKKDEKEEAKEPKEEAKEEKPEAEAKEPEAKPEQKDEKPAEAQEAKDESKEEPKDEQKEEEGHGYDDADLEEMHKMYSSMSKGERKAHMDALNKCGEMVQMAKSEPETTTLVVTPEAQVSDAQVGLLKSEVETVKKENDELKKNIESLVTAMNTFLTKKPAPARKAITDIDFVKKSEDKVEDRLPTKSEVTKILLKKSQDPNLSANDRTAINDFYFNRAGLEKIKHLLINS